MTYRHAQFITLIMSVIAILIICSITFVLNNDKASGEQPHKPVKCFPPPDVVCTGEVHFGDRGMSVLGCNLYGETVTLQCSNGLCCAFKPGDE
jgi:hypothetical protein